MKRYENFVGLTEVKAAQGKVVQMEKEFVETQELRRELQMKVRRLSRKTSLLDFTGEEKRP